ncbi:hypothetical protein [Kitasatospora kifunensis]|uniref:Uncharacterized protein n=1 Tax=Kitasatospora kifunensis TaxID=58351 RepID=A0A7W7RA73_KITKI|nr:hypothetical protein [Kitasatospora kifunensis]MBB4928267.1 hypothetical protein [Kitasatospora kifunensis]
MFSNDTTFQYLLTLLRARLADLRDVKEKDRGALSIEMAILVAVLVAGGIALGVFLAAKLTEKENAIK